jgi:hypothetical protein
MPGYAGLGHLPGLFDNYYDQFPEFGFMNYLTGRGYDLNSNFGRWAQSQYGRLYNQFGAQLPNNPNQTFDQFMNGIDLRSEWQNLAPSMRGTRMGLYAPRLRWLTDTR